MVTGIGVDIEAVSRFKESYKDEHFLRLVFTDTEIAYCLSKHEPYISFAGKFCAKEAVVKASPLAIKIREVEILNEDSGKIKVLVKGKEMPYVLCSISHTEDYAVAFVIINDGKNTK